MFPHDGSLTLELGAREPFRDILQDGNNIYKETTRNKKLSNSPDSFFCNLAIGVVIRANFDAVRHRYWDRADKTNSKKMKSVFTSHQKNMVNGTYVRTCCKKSLGFCKSWPRKRLTYIISRGWLKLGLDGLKCFVNIRRLDRQTSP